MSNHRPSISYQDMDGPALTSCSYKENYYFPSFLACQWALIRRPLHAHVPFFLGRTWKGYASGSILQYQPELPDPLRP
jgi:hypothetical protein